MADLSDVQSAIADIATAACFPNGTTSPSITNRAIYIMQGWPKPQDLDRVIGTGSPALVSIYDVQGSTGTAEQVFEPLNAITVQPIGVSSQIDDATGQVVTLSGTPGAGEYATLTIDGASVYTYTALAGDTLLTFAANLAALVLPDYPGTSVNGASITIPGTFKIIARNQAPILMGKTIHRQTQQFRIVTWANNPTDRTTIAKAVDVAMKQNLRLVFDDTSEAIMTYQGTYSDDARQNEGLYRRDLMFAVKYATTEQIYAYPVTSIQVDSPEPGSEINTLGLKFKS